MRPPCYELPAICVAWSGLGGFSKVLQSSGSLVMVTHGRQLRAQDRQATPDEEDKAVQPKLGSFCTWNIGVLCGVCRKHVVRNGHLLKGPACRSASCPMRSFGCTQCSNQALCILTSSCCPTAQPASAAPRSLGDALLLLLYTDKPLRTGMPAHRRELACRLTVQQVPAARKSLSNSMHC